MDEMFSKGKRDPKYGQDMIEINFLEMKKWLESKR